MRPSSDIPLHFAVLTANCGNSTLGRKSCDALLQTLSDDNGTAFIVVHCQELHYPHQQEELLKKLPETVGYLFSALMPTYTKPTWDVIRGHTGIASLVLYNKSKIKALSFDPAAAQKVRGQNPNKGGYFNQLLLTDHHDHHHRIQLISAHLDSNSEKRRQKDWQNIKKHTTFHAKSWEELEQKVPELQLAGYDTNIRDAWDDASQTPINLWQQSRLDDRIVSLALAPLGSRLYSRDNTYGHDRTIPIQDPNRPGYARQGPLDFVAIQDNTHPPERPVTGIRYEEAPLCYPHEASTRRDHDMVGVDHLPLHTAPTPFDRIKHHISAELLYAAPRMADEILTLTDTKENRERLVRLHNYYLNPEGAVIKKITAKHDTVSPWFSKHSLEDEQFMHLFCQHFKSKFESKTNSDGIKEMMQYMDKLQQEGCIDLQILGQKMHEIAKKRQHSWYSKSHFFGPGRDKGLVQPLYDELATIDFSTPGMDLKKTFHQLTEFLELHVKQSVCYY